MTNLTCLDLIGTGIDLLPIWINELKGISIIRTDESLGTTFHLITYCERVSAGSRFVDLIAKVIHDYIDKGGDWTVILGLPKHLRDKIVSPPLGDPTNTIVLRTCELKMIKNIGHDLPTGNTAWLIAGAN